MHVLNTLWVVLGIGLMLVLDLKFKINSMVAPLMATLSVGVLANMDLTSLSYTMKAGFGSTLGELVIIVVFGAVIDKLMVDSGAAYQITHMPLACLSLRHVRLPVIIIGLVFDPTMFYEAAFTMSAPLIIITVAGAKTPSLKLAIPAIATATTTYSLSPPQPGPVALVNARGTDVGMVHIYDVLVTTPSVVCAGLILPRPLGNPERPTPSFLRANQPVNMNNLPSFGISILASPVPTIITISTTITDIWLIKDIPVREVVNFIGSSSIAMFIAMAAAFVFSGTTRGRNMQRVMNALKSAAKSIAMVTPIIGMGDMLKRIIVDIGIGDTTGMLMSHGNISPYIMVWLITVLIRLVIDQGAALTMTAAGITSVAILGPATGRLVGVNLALLVLTTAAGSNILTHINDTSFWLSRGYFGLSIKDTSKAWGLLELVNSVVGLIIVLIISIVT